jgi:hypothetical protein
LYLGHLVVAGHNRENYHPSQYNKDNEADTDLRFDFHKFTTMPALTG